MLGFTPILSLTGGILIGLATVLMMAVGGRIVGISGIAFGAILGDGERWRWYFLTGLVLGGALVFWLTPFQFALRENFPPVMIILAGLLVGLGTRLGSGCTSGHGVCGLSRLSIRSVVATVTFVLVGVLTATLLSPDF